MNFLMIFISLLSAFALLLVDRSLKSYARQKEKQQQRDIKTNRQLIRQEKQSQERQYILECKADSKRIQQENQEKNQQRKDIKTDLRHARREEKYQERKNIHEQKVERKRIQQANKEQEKKQRKDTKTDRKRTRQEARVDRPLT